MHLPVGVMVLAILSIIGGIFSLLWGMAVAGLGGLSWLTGTVTFAETARTWGGSALWSGLLNMLLGSVQLMVGVGLFSGNFWSIFGLIIPGLILFYLMTPHVWRAFGRA